jgi:Tol biopolymer transport system component
MSNRLKTSLYWWTVVLFLVSGCTPKGLPDVAPLSSSTVEPTEVVGTQVGVETAVLEPAVPVSTLIVPTASITGDCKKIAFSEYDGQNYDIYSVCPDGSGLVNLTNDPSDDVNPAWSPDGTKLAFSSARSGHFQIYQMSEDGTGVTALTSDYENLNPVWLPDGRHIAFRTDDGKGLFWWRVLALENSELTTITEPSYDFFFQTPAWSPDGQSIAYMSLVEQQERNDGSSQIHVNNVDGTNDIALTADIWANFNPKWSPDGSKIAFLSERGGTNNLYNLYIMNKDGTGVQQLSETGYPEDVVYSWSPDGRQIVIGNNNLFSGISIIDIVSRTSHPLMEWNTPANVSWPSWQP